MEELPDNLFGEWCRLTRHGGSEDDPEVDQCDCKCPRDCKAMNIPGFEKFYPWKFKKD